MNSQISQCRAGFSPPVKYVTYKNYNIQQGKPVHNKNNKQIYKVPCMPTEGCRGAEIWYTS